MAVNINKRKKKPENDNELIISRTLEDISSNMSLDKIIQYQPMRSSMSKFVRFNAEVPDFAQMLRFNNAYLKLIFQGSGSLFIKSYELTGSQVRLRDGYIWGNHNFCTQNFSVISVLSSQLIKLEPSQIHNFITSFIFQAANSLKKEYANVFQSIERRNSLRQFFTDFYNQIISPNKEVLTSQLSNETSNAISNCMWIFNILNEELFKETIGIFLLDEHRIINSQYLIHDENGTIFNLDFLLNNFTGWDNMDLMKNVLLSHSVLESVNFSKILKKYDLSKMHLFFIENRRVFLKSYKNTSGFVYYIQTLCGGLNKDTLEIVVSALHRNIVKYEMLEAEGLSIRTFLSQNSSLLDDQDVCLMVITEGIELELNDEMKFKMLQIFMNRFNNLNFFKKIVNKTIGVDTFLDMYPRIIENTTMTKQLEEHFLGFFNDLSDEKFLEFVNKQIKPFDNSSANHNISLFVLLINRLFNQLNYNEHLIKNIVKILQKNGWFDDPLSVYALLNNGEDLSSEASREHYMNMLFEQKHYFSIFEILFDIKDLQHSSSTHKMFFCRYVQKLKELSKEEIFKKHFIDLRKNNPLHSFLDRVLNFYMIEDGAKEALQRFDYQENKKVWESLDKLLDFFRTYFGLQYLQQEDDEGVSVRDKFRAINSVVHLGNNSTDAIDVSEYCLRKEPTFKNRLMFWKKEEEVLPSFNYLYISPQGPLLSNEVIPSFIEIVDVSEGWKKKHEDGTKTAYALLQLGNIPTDISLQAKDLIRNFKNVAENIEPIRAQLNFEEEMFFEQSFFNDLIGMLNAHNNGVGNLKIMKNISPEQHQELIVKSQENCQRIMGMLQTQMDNISNDIFKNLVSKSNFDLEVLAEYVKSRNFGKS